MKIPRHVFPLFASGITLSINSRHFFAIDEEGHAFHLFRAEHVDVRRKGDAGLPRFGRIVIA